MRFPDWLPVYGDPHYRGDCLREDTEQINFFSLLTLHHPILARLAVHPKNGMKRSWGRIDIDRKTGALNKGASDILIPGDPTFVCELKRRDHTLKGVCWQSGQIDYLRAAKDAGCFVCVALGADAAIAAVDDWLKQKSRD